MTNSLIGGRYCLGDRLGEGSGGSVFEAKDEATGVSVAVKLVGGADPAAEWRIGRRVVSEGIVRTRDFGVDADRGGYVVLSLARGKSLDEWWRGRAGEAVPPWDELRSVIDQVVAALGAIHRAGMVHLDLKPAHILVADPGSRTLLLDFGLARPIGGPLSDLTGTPHYVAPELARGAAPTQAADLFGLGACLYHALTGMPPHDGEDSRAILAAAQAGDHVPIDDVIPQPPLSLQDMPLSLVDMIEALLVPHPDGRSAPLSPSRGSGALPPFVGRAKALSDADHWLRDRPCGVLRITGDPGIGRSRLLREVAAGARAEGWRVLVIASEEPWMRAIETLERWAAALGVEAGLVAGPGENAPWEAIHAYRAHRIGALLDRLSERIGTPLLLSVDGPDDPVTLDLLHRSWRDAGFRSATLAAVCGSDGPSETIRIEALTAEECGELVEGLGIRGPAIERLRAVSRGQPGSLLATLRRLDPPSLGVATDEDAIAAIDRAGTQGSKEILDQLAAIDAPSMKILEVVAILRNPARPADLRVILSRHGPELDEDVDELRDRGLLVRRDDGSFELGSEAAAEILDEELGRVRAQRLHQQVLESLDANAPDERVAHHLVGA
ncbi:MAG: hypothetical protein CME06_13850, partial [Gemmatimonadetes bacterium]|nr:hypothetical protein [Gemmatimonadota bacterium]